MPNLKKIRGDWIDKIIYINLIDNCMRKKSFAFLDNLSTANEWNQYV